MLLSGGALRHLSKAMPVAYAVWKLCNIRRNWLQSACQPEARAL